MELRGFVEKALLEIVDGVKAADSKASGLRLTLEEKISFTLSILVSEEKKKDGSMSLNLKVISGDTGKRDTAKEEAYHTVSFAVSWDKEKVICELPDFSVDNSDLP